MTRAILRLVNVINGVLLLLAVFQEPVMEVDVFLVMINGNKPASQVIMLHAAWFMHICE